MYVCVFVCVLMTVTNLDAVPLGQHKERERHTENEREKERQYACACVCRVVCVCVCLCVCVCALDVVPPRQQRQKMYVCVECK